MEIHFASTKLRKCCESFNEAKRVYGEDNAKKIIQRLNELKSFNNLEDVGRLPQAGLHPLKGDRKGQYAVNVKQPYRLVFEPVNDESRVEELRKVTAVRILEVVNYHD